MKYADVIKKIMDTITDELVISSTGRISREVYNIRDRARNFYILGSMGASLGVGIGIALHTEQTVHVISGDGDILMSLSTLVLMNKLRLPNLYLTILDNNCFETTGGQKTCSDAIDFNKVCPQNCEVIQVDTGKSDTPRINLFPRDIMERFHNEIIKRR